MDPDVRAFFRDRPEAARLYRAVHSALRSLGDFEGKVSKSQIAFRRRRAFAWAWTPDRWLHGDTAPLVLSISLSRQDASPRWKEVVEPKPGRWMHHLELYRPADVDDEVTAWLREAWDEAG